jgi:hypothetical protein
MWGPEPLERKIKYLVSIGTGVPQLKPFRDDVFHIGETLLAIATETERTTERFQRHLDEASRYYRFNVACGLEDIGLEESIKRKEIATATQRYLQAQEVFKGNNSNVTMGRTALVANRSALGSPIVQIIWILVLSRTIVMIQVALKAKDLRVRRMAGIMEMTMTYLALMRKRRKTRKKIIARKTLMKRVAVMRTQNQITNKTILHRNTW